MARRKRRRDQSAEDEDWTCYLCGCETSPLNVCRGCEELICPNCRVSRTGVGYHFPEDHNPPEARI